MLIAGKAGFIKDFNDYAGVFTDKPDPHRAVIDAGEFTPSPFSLHQSISAVTWPFLVLGFGIASAYIGGEIKTGRNTFLKSVTGSVVYSAVFMAAIIAIFFAVAGDEFLGALGLADPEVIGFAFTPTFAELGAMAERQPLLRPDRRGRLRAVDLRVDAGLHPVVVALRCSPGRWTAWSRPSSERSTRAARRRCSGCWC